MPWKFAAGVYTTFPPTIMAEPAEGAPTATTVNESPSTSLSLPNTATATAVSSGVVAVSSSATGASLTARTVIVTVAVSERPPGSVTV